MWNRTVLFAVLLGWLIPTALPADSPKAAQDSGPARPISAATRLLMVRDLDSESVTLRCVIPAGAKVMVIQGGQLLPQKDDEFQRPSNASKPKAKPGDRAQITDIEFKDDRIVFAMNGGSKKKTKWWQEIHVGGMGGISQSGDSHAKKNPQGWDLELAFDKFVPEMTSKQVRQLLLPVFEFKARSAAEAYLDTVPPKVKAALEKHQVLVGMNHEMVMYAKGRPDKRIRERDKQGRAYEEWLYGTPPQEVQFVRFIGDEVVRLEIMTVDGKDIVRTNKEVDLKPASGSNHDTAVALPADEPSWGEPGKQRAPGIASP